MDNSWCLRIVDDGWYTFNDDDDDDECASCVIAPTGFLIHVMYACYIKFD